MKFAKSLLIGTANFALAGFVLILAAPKSMHAVVATLVQVANTSSNPAIISNMDTAGRIPYQSQAVYTAGPTECTVEGCQLSFGSVPANHRLVVQHLSADLIFSSSPGQVSLEYFGTGIAGGLTSAPPAFENTYQVRDAFELPVQFYVDPGQSFQVNVQAGAPLVGGTVTASGYMLDCSAAACSAISQ